ncbi:MAG: hypothetical protein AAF699_17125 [Pseudomonadota bacterium]
MNFKYLIFALCLLVLAAYVVLVSSLFYSSPPFVTVSYGVTGQGMSYGPPRDLVLLYALCCEDLGKEGTDEQHLITTVINIGVYNQEDEELLIRSERTIRTLVNDKNLSVDWIDPRTGMTSLHKAVTTFEPWAVQLLLELGADPCIPVSSPSNKYQGQTALQLAHGLVDLVSNLSDEELKTFRETFDGPLELSLPMLQNASEDCEAEPGALSAASVSPNANGLPL